MKDYFARNAEDLCDFLVALEIMKKDKRTKPKALKAFFDMGCDCYGKSTIITYAEWLGEYDVIRGLV